MQQAVDGEDCNGLWWLLSCPIWTFHQRRHWAGGHLGERSTELGNQSGCWLHLVVPTPCAGSGPRGHQDQAGWVGLVSASQYEASLDLSRTRCKLPGVILTCHRAAAGLLGLADMDLDSVFPHCLPLTAQTYLEVDIFFFFFLICFLYCLLVFI